jgi:inhibitor of KinA sporulation pathway (predicted exonuclease)
MNFILFDLEATCGENIEEKDREIIQIGAVKYNHELKETGRFSIFVKPYKNPILTEYCTNLTKITQEMVDNAIDRGTAIEEFKEWANLRSEYSVLISWGGYDKRELTKIQSHNEYLENFADLKNIYQKIRKTKRGTGLDKAMRIEGFSFEGEQHNALTDSIAMSRIFVKRFKEFKPYLNI